MESKRISQATQEKPTRQTKNSGDKNVFVFRGAELIVPAGESIRLLDEREVALLENRFLRSAPMERGTPDGDRWAEIGACDPVPDGFTAKSLRDIWAPLGEEAFARAGRAFELMDWQRSSLYCGKCGLPTRDHETESARVCECGHLHFPVLAPAIIVAVEREGKLLLAHGAQFPPGRYSVLAGFVEPGESVEQTVHREVFEEVGVRIRNLHYFGSQSWPFPHSLMLGFTAEWESGELCPDGVEIEHADWFSPETMPEIPPSISISRRLIDQFLIKHSRQK